MVYDRWTSCILLSIIWYISALVRTYCYDTTVADSACSATSYLCGVELNHRISLRLIKLVNQNESWNMTNQVKGNYETVGVSAEVKLGDCAAQQVRTWYLHTWCKNGTKWNVQADISSAIFRWIFLFHKMDRRCQKTGSPACWPGHKRKARLLVLSQPTGLKKQQQQVFESRCSLTGASPAGTYAHAADRDWENDEVM